ncbi:unnamed protein product [Phyllotreta striolata]|uniref:Interference hedgehog n=1 Tax=Phyllotreta striolata TaxID=444603 RepID=A0A9N9TTL2_PHYSR|nr:unnamed protein product [Phyllotreta striolata]
MEGARIVPILAVLATFIRITVTDRHMVSDPEPIALPLGFTTLMTCEMDIEPDKFEWKFYPTDDPYDPDAFVDLSSPAFRMIPQGYTKQRKKSLLTLQVNSTQNAGDYQCLAYYGAYVVASIPWRLTIAKLGEFPRQAGAEATVAPGNAVLWRCPAPESNPEASIEYYKGGELVNQRGQTKSLVLGRVGVEDTGIYTCRATNTIKTANSTAYLRLKVDRYAPYSQPRFIVEPKKTYTVLKGDSVSLECAAVGNPVPDVVWTKGDRRLIHSSNGTLTIHSASRSDEGEYVCTHTNSLGSIARRLTLVYREEPTIDCPVNRTDPKQGEPMDVRCTVGGAPPPRLSWFLNGFSVLNDSLIETRGGRIDFARIEKRHAGNLQLFARNSVRTVYAGIYVGVIPLSSTDSSVAPTRPHKKHSSRRPAKHNKPPKLIPPSKPVISRLNDESVVVRWNVSQDTGLPISFFKVQYKELGPANPASHNGSGGGGRSSRWKTANFDIPPSIRDYDITNLKPDHVYRFRIAAVYSNNDNKLSPNSEKFHLKKLDFDVRNPLPTPIVTRTETINTTVVKIYWTCPSSENIPIDGYYVSFMSASTAGDYMKATADGKHTKEYVITHLQPDTIYDVKLQSFNSKYASEFSAIMKARTEALQQAPLPTTITPIVPTPRGEKSEFSLYVIVAGAVIGCALLICAVTLVFVCRKWQQKKSVDNRDKAIVDDHTLQLDGNEYVVVGTKSNGCTPNRITITANPLADADNKNQNMIEMSCLSAHAQNNNCANAVRQESTSGGGGDGGVAAPLHSPVNSKDASKKKKNREREREREKAGSRHKKAWPENSSSGENYV